MVATYLILNALLWIGLGIYCSLAPDKTSKSLGFTLDSAAGRCEYITVYGGLEIGLGAFFLYGAIDSAWASAAVLAALFSYVGLGLLRLLAVLFVKPAGKGPLIMLGVEVVMAAWAAWIHFA